MVMCGSYKFEFSDSKGMKKWYNKGGGNRESSNTFMSSTNYQRTEN
jgi:hypothetical protein